MFATGETMGLAEWIIDDTYLVVLLTSVSNGQVKICWSKQILKAMGT